ncbi:MAG: ABC transporter permease [Clostridia bacterium]
MRNKTPLISKLYIVFIMIFLYAPILTMVVFSFNASESSSVFSGFSLQWYQSLLNDSSTMTALKNTMILASTSAICATILGTAAAVGINAYKKNWTKNMVMNVTNIPMMNPEIVTGISLMLLFVFVGGMLGFVNTLGFWTMLIAHITFNLPYVILSVLPKLRQLNPALNEAALDLGCTPVQSFFKVVLPSISTGIITGFLMSFTLSVDDFVISYFTQGASFETLSIRIFSMTKKRVTPDMYAISTVIFVGVLLVLVGMNIYQARSEKKAKNKLD